MIKNLLSIFVFNKKSLRSGYLGNSIVIPIIHILTFLIFVSVKIGVAQVYIICGANNGTSGTQDAMPINVYYEGNRVQWIVSAAEISSGGWAGGFGKEMGGHAMTKII